MYKYIVLVSMLFLFAGCKNYESIDSNLEYMLNMVFICHDNAAVDIVENEMNVSNFAQLPEMYGIESYDVSNYDEYVKDKYSNYVDDKYLPKFIPNFVTGMNIGLREYGISFRPVSIEISDEMDGYTYGFVVRIEYFKDSVKTSDFAVRGSLQLNNNNKVIYFRISEINGLMDKIAEDRSYITEIK